jgi:hypothetical protein
MNLTEGLRNIVGENALAWRIHASGLVILEVHRGVQLFLQEQQNMALWLTFSQGPALRNSEIIIFGEDACLRFGNYNRLALRAVDRHRPRELIDRIVHDFSIPSRRAHRTIVTAKLNDSSRFFKSRRSADSCTVP